MWSGPTPVCRIRSSWRCFLSGTLYPPACRFSTRSRTPPPPSNPNADILYAYIFLVLLLLLVTKNTFLPCSLSRFMTWGAPGMAPSPRQMTPLQSNRMLSTDSSSCFTSAPLSLVHFEPGFGELKAMLSAV